MIGLAGPDSANGGLYWARTIRASSLKIRPDLAESMSAGPHKSCDTVTWRANKTGTGEQAFPVRRNLVTAQRPCEDSESADCDTWDGSCNSGRGRGFTGG
jgi:hypothetical protein